MLYTTNAFVGDNIAWQSTVLPGKTCAFAAVSSLFTAASHSRNARQAASRAASALSDFASTFCTTWTHKRRVQEIVLPECQAIGIHRENLAMYDRREKAKLLGKIPQHSPTWFRP